MMKLVETDVPAKTPGASDDEYQAAIARARKNGAKYTVMTHEDGNGGVWTDQVNVPSLVHEEGIMFMAMNAYVPNDT